MSGTAPPNIPPPSSKIDGPIFAADPLGPRTPLDPDPLEDQLQAIFAPLLQLPGRLVRPRFQTDAPNQPPLGTDWAAIGPRNQQPDSSQFVSRELEDSEKLPGVWIERRRHHESFDVLISCYGPGSRRRLEELRSLLMVSQNRWALRRAGMGIQDLGQIMNVSYLTDQQLNLQKHDLAIAMRRQIQRRYRVYNFAEASVILTAPPPPT